MQTPITRNLTASSHRARAGLLWLAVCVALLWGQGSWSASTPADQGYLAPDPAGSVNDAAARVAELEDDSPELAPAVFASAAAAPPPRPTLPVAGPVRTQRRWHHPAPRAPPGAC